MEPSSRRPGGSITKLLIKDLDMRLRIASEVFLLAEPSVAETKTGSPYLKAPLADRMGRIEARYWDLPTEIAVQLKVGSAVRIDAIIEEWPEGSGERQIRIERLAPVEILDFEDFLPQPSATWARCERNCNRCVSVFRTTTYHPSSTTCSQTQSSMQPSARHRPPSCTTTPASAGCLNTLWPSSSCASTSPTSTPRSIATFS